MLEMGSYHFEILNLGYGAYNAFREFCQDAFPGITDQTIARMVAGIDIMYFRPDDEVRTLARKAVDLGFADAVHSITDPDELLAEIGRTGKPVLIKRGLSSTLEELLMAAEYVLKEGNPNVMLCERGIRTFETSYRFTLDITAVPMLKELSHLPVIVDPSHAPGRRDMVLPLSLAAAAAGADGIIVEVHPNPEEAICDGPQQIYADSFGAYLEQVERAAAVAGKVLSAAA